MMEKDQILHLLKDKGIKPEESTMSCCLIYIQIIWEELASFRMQNFILTQEVYDVYKKPKLKDLIFKEFLPSDFEERLTVIKANQQKC